MMKSSESRSGKRPHSSRELVPWSYPLIAFGAIAMLLFVFLTQYAQLVRAQYEVVELKDKQTRLVREENALELQIDRLTSLERIDQIAVSRLKMAPPATREVLDLSAWDKAHKAKKQVASR